MSLRIVTLSGRDADNPSRGYGDLNFYIPHHRYGWVECAHQVILPLLARQFMNTYGHGAT
jgi:D-sedoheptulose 7-phosphate isomerase